MALEQGFEYLSQHLFKRKYQEAQREKRYGGHRSEPDNILHVKGDGPHVANQRITVSQVGKRLDVTGTQEFIVRRSVPNHPFLLKCLYIGAGESSVVAQSLTLGAGKFGRKHGEWSQHEYKEKCDKSYGLHFEGEQLFASVQDATCNEACK